MEDWKNKLGASFYYRSIEIWSFLFFYKLVWISYVESVAVRETESSNQTNALILSASDSVADHHHSPDRSHREVSGYGWLEGFGEGYELMIIMKQRCRLRGQEGIEVIDKVFYGVVQYQVV